MGNTTDAFKAWVLVNQRILKTALHNKKYVTLDIDATQVVVNKKDVQWTYQKKPGYMPMVGHIAEVSQIVACDFRPGNAAPAKENLEFIQQCEQALPAGIQIGKLRIDAAGYQQKIIEYCDQHTIEYAIRAKLSGVVKDHIKELDEQQWHPFIHRRGSQPKPANLSDSALHR